VGSPEFDRFVGLLGDKIRLKGWDKYRGGLDVKGDMTGRYSIYTIYEGHEIMFHVSTLLPYSKDNRQQVERKRHIGNDIVNIVFVDGGGETMSQFNPSFIKSQFTHIFALVSYEDGKNNSEDSEGRHYSGTGYRLTVFSEESAMMMGRRAFSDVLSEGARSSRRKEEARRQVELVRIGQALKLESIVKGDAPTSLATTGLFKRPQPWEPHCFYPDFPSEVICGDSWGESRLVVATENGVHLVEEGLSQRVIFDKTVVVKQLSVVEAHGILLLRADK
ncbi:hypothetical protein J437_LFUL013468, partial [Ladona fulva]